MLKMFKKRDKDAITIRQDRKIKAIIMNSINWYITKTLKGENPIKYKKIQRRLR